MDRDLAEELRVLRAAAAGTLVKRPSGRWAIVGGLAPAHRERRRLQRLDWIAVRPASSGEDRPVTLTTEGRPALAVMEQSQQVSLFTRPPETRGEPTRIAEVGQIWASTHAGDVERGARQRRRVMSLDGLRAELLTEGQTRPSFCSLDRYGAIKWHRLVEDPHRPASDDVHGSHSAPPQHADDVPIDGGPRP